MTKIHNSKLYDLEDRTFRFAKDTALFVKQLPIMRNAGKRERNFLMRR